MASQAQHKTKWLHNRRFVGSVGDEFADWLVTAMFYTALHAVETLFAHDGVRVHESHTARNQTLKRIARYQNIWANYRPLLDAGRAARYEVDTGDWIPAGEARKQLLPHLYRLEQSVLKLMEAGEPLPPISGSKMV